MKLRKALDKAKDERNLNEKPVLKQTGNGKEGKERKSLNMHNPTCAFWIQ